MIKFGNIQFYIDENSKIFIGDCGCFHDLNSHFAEIQIAGEHKPSHMGIKMLRSSEHNRLQYISHRLSENRLSIVQQSKFVECTTQFTSYDDSNALRIQTTVKNVTSHPIVLEEVGAFTLCGLGDKNNPHNMFVTKFLQSHHAECQPRTYNFAELGLYGGRSESQQRTGHSSIGSWSTKEALPMGIIEDRKNKAFMMFQIESNSSWYYEISDAQDKYYLYLSGPNTPFGGWFKRLLPGEYYTTPSVAIAFGQDLNDVIGNMTLYRRHIAGKSPADQNLPTIFNEYMHLSWDSPTAENTAKYASIVAKTGVEYYVIDCGWHNEEPGDQIYPYVGQWIESNARFPEGVRKTTDYIRSLGMKPGLWIEPEIIGFQCEDMLKYYDEDCFFQRHGKRLSVAGRHFLDYRNPKVRDYMTKAVSRMIEEYGAEYIKCDYNQDCGVGTDLNADNPGEGLELATQAFLQWMQELIAKYPHVVFEGCASGGMRMDYKTLSAYSLVSTSDQTDYKLYPYIAGNILSAVLPEQAAVWSYPVASDCQDGSSVSDERIAMNMINSFLGRMHLASHLDYLTDRQIQLVKEGVDYYKTLSEVKRTALPYFPLGFTRFGESAVCAGFRNGKQIYLAAWNLGDIHSLQIPIAKTIQNAKIAYPSFTSASLSCNSSGVEITFPENNCAVFLEITTQ